MQGWPDTQIVCMCVACQGKDWVFVTLKVVEIYIKSATHLKACQAYVSVAAIFVNQKVGHNIKQIRLDRENEIE